MRTHKYVSASHIQLLSTTIQRVVSPCVPLRLALSCLWSGAWQYRHMFTYLLEYVYTIRYVYEQRN